MRILWIMAFISLFISGYAGANVDIERFSSAAQERQYRELTQQLRCPKCQNNSIADSNSMIAADMRAKVYQLVQQGQSRRQIVDYMVARYGNFVTYVPPLNPLTMLLWLGPLLVVLSGGLMVIRRAARRRAGMDNIPFSDEERRRLAELLAEQRGNRP